MWISHLIFSTLILVESSWGSTEIKDITKELFNTEKFILFDLSEKNNIIIHYLSFVSTGIHLRNLPSQKLTKNITNLLSTDLKMLKVSTQIRDIENDIFSRFKSLEYLDLSGVDLGNSHVFSSSAEFTKNLIMIDLSNNTLSNVTFLKTISNNLRRIDIHENQLDKIPTELKVFKNLKTLILNHNRIKNFSVNHEFLTVDFLDLSYNSISTMSGLQNFPNLFILNLTNNFIKNLEEEYFEHNCVYLRELWLDHNKIESLSAEIIMHCSQLKSLSMRNNNMTKLKLSYSDHSHLEYLDLGINSLTEIDSIFLRAFSNLKTLKLDHNKLFTLEPDTFANLNNLVYLYLSNNLNFKFNFNRLIPLQSLSFLDISQNDFYNLDYMSLILHNSNLKRINLGRNRFTCTHLVEMFSFFDINEIVIEDAYCHGTNIRGLCCYDTDPNEDSNDLTSNQKLLLSMKLFKEIFSRKV